jgi:8-oxo-dGTP pyrophosphatase MutT (NUDIX family)
VKFGVKLSDLITPDTLAGTALFLQWEGYHVFAIPQRELQNAEEQVRFFGVGGKRQAQESLIDCALREGREEIGAVVSRLDSAAQTYFFKADGGIDLMNLTDDSVRPRLILEKRTHSLHGSMANQSASYYLVAFNASLSGPSNEIAAVVYLKDFHLALMRRFPHLTVADLLAQGAQVESQPNSPINRSTVLVAHGTAKFLMRQLPL